MHHKCFQGSLVELLYISEKQYKRDDSNKYGWVRGNETSSVRVRCDRPCKENNCTTPPNIERIETKCNCGVWLLECDINPIKTDGTWNCACELNTLMICGCKCGGK